MPIAFFQRGTFSGWFGTAVDELIQFLDYPVSLQHEPTDTRILIDLNCFALRERVRLSHEPGCLSLR